MAEEKDRLEAEVNGDGSFDFDHYENYDKAINPNNIVNASDIDHVGVRAKKPEDDLFAVDEAEGGVQFMAVKPWVGSLFAPTNAPSNNPEPPTQDLEMEWIYGYRAYDSRSNLVVNSDGEIVYPCASVVVMYDHKTHTQRHFQGHNDDVICLAQNPANPDIVASGQVATIVDRKATLPHICVLNTKTGQSWTLKNAHKRAVRAVAFSHDGKYLASVGDDDNFTVTVWDWEKQEKLASEKGDSNKIFHLRWNHVKPDEFVTVGKSHVFFWTFADGTLKKTRGKFGTFPDSSFSTVAFSDKGYACVGSKEGAVYIFVGSEAKKSFNIHKGAIFSLTWYPGGMISGGEDGKAIILDKNVKPIQTVQVPGQVRAVYVKDQKLFVGTSQSEIYEVDNFTTNNVPGPALVGGHWDGELWALAVHHSGKQFVTAGEDNQIGVWDISEHKLVKKGIITDKKGKRLPRVNKACSLTLHPSNQCARAIDYSPDGKHIALGNNYGELFVYDAETLESVATHDLNEFGKRNVKLQIENWIQTLKYSPDGKTLAVGTHGIVIVLCDVSNGYKPSGTLKAHNAAITHLDWSKDGAHIQSNCRAYELLFHNVDSTHLSNSDQNRSPSKLRDVEWETQTCIFGWPVAGIFDPQQDGSDVNTADIGRSKRFLATGDDYGYVNLFRYPANEKGNHKKVKGGHSSHVVLVRFTPDEKYLLSVGGNDKSIIQWRVKE